MKLIGAVKKIAGSQLGSLLLASSILFTIIQYCWIADHTHIFEKVPKNVDPRAFLLCVSACVFGTLKSWSIIIKFVQSKPINMDSDTPFLPREQTEEWKGWMQAVILLYHYFGLSTDLPIYQVVRVLVAAYIFLTGYSHTTYFLTSNDFSINRTAKVLLRLNLLSCVLAYVMNKSWDFYYFPGLTSFWYMVILATTRASRTPSGNYGLPRLVACFSVSCFLVQTLLYSEFGKMLCVVILNRVHMVGGPQIRPQELNFRLKLDSLVPYWGAALAIFITKKNAQSDAPSQQSSTARAPYQRFTIHAPLIGLIVITAYFLAIQIFKDKETSNAWHPLSSIIPIVAMLVVRNAKPQWQLGFNRVFRWLGSISLEIYILQSHTWLTSNNKELLRLNLVKRFHVRPDSILSTPTALLDRIVITVVFLVASHLAAHATRKITDWLMSGSKSKIVVLLLLCWMLNLHWHRLS